MDLSRDRPVRLLLYYSLPAMVGQLSNAVYNLVDRILISYSVGPQAFSSMAVTGAVFVILQSVGMLIGIGAATRISLALGDGDQRKAEELLGNAFTALIFTSLAVTLFVLGFLPHVLLFFGASADTISYGMDYLRIIMLGFPAMTLGVGLYHIIRAIGNPNRAMLSMVLSAVLNVVLDAIFLFAFRWGVAGAAAATVLSQAAAMIYILHQVLRSRTVIHLRRSSLRPRSAVMGTIYLTGFSVFFTQVASSMIQAVANNQLLRYENSYAVGAYGAINITYMIFLMPVYGIGQGCQPIIGYNYGAKLYRRARNIFYLSLFLAFGAGLAGWLCFQLGAQPLMALFTNHNADIMGYAVPGLRKLTFFFPLATVQAVGQVYFQTIGRPKLTLFLSAVRQLVFFIPLFYLLPLRWGTDGIWYTVPVTELCALICTSTALVIVISHMRRQEGEGPSAA